MRRCVGIGAALLLLALSTVDAAAEIEVTILVDDAYRPYSFIGEDGQATGIYIDILRTAFARMEGFKVAMAPIPWRRGKVMMENGDAFGLTPVFFHGHDWPYLYPYSLAFYTEKITAFCTAEVLEPFKPHWPEDYIGLRIGNVAGFDGWGGDAFRKLVDAKRIHYEEAKGSTGNMLKLMAGRLDCIMMEEGAFAFELQRLKRSERYQRASQVTIRKGAVIGTDPVYIGYSKKAIENGDYPFHLEFRQAFDNEIYQMIKSGEIEAIISGYDE